MSSTSATGDEREATEEEPSVASKPVERQNGLHRTGRAHAPACVWYRSLEICTIPAWPLRTA